MFFTKFHSPDKIRFYKFDYNIVREVQSSLKIDGKGYKQISAVCSDGKIRPVMLRKYQKGYYLRGYVNVRNIAIMGWVDTSNFANKFSNVGIIFFQDPNSINKDELPEWYIPSYTMPARKKDIR